MAERIAPLRATQVTRVLDPARLVWKHWLFMKSNVRGHAESIAIALYSWIKTLQQTVQYRPMPGSGSNSEVKKAKNNGVPAY
jgi:hypothetical protein